jgi:hypothetical protein
MTEKTHSSRLADVKALLANEPDVMKELVKETQQGLAEKIRQALNQPFALDRLILGIPAASASSSIPTTARAGSNCPIMLTWSSLTSRTPVAIGYRAAGRRCAGTTPEPLRQIGAGACAAVGKRVRPAL